MLETRFLHPCNTASFLMGPHRSFFSFRLHHTACGIFSSLTRIALRPCVGNMESQRLDDQGNPMEPYIFQSWGAGTPQVSLGKLSFPICKWEVATPGALWDHSSRADASASARLQVSLPSQWGW